MKNNKNALYEVIKCEIDKFDAFGLLESNSPKDEFDLETKMIFERLKKGMAKEQISIIIAKVFSEMFNYEFNSNLFEKHATIIEKELNKK